MREIFFRAKSIHDGKWVYGNLVYDGANFIIVELNTKKKSIRFVQVNPNTICQFTGLTDKKGNKIFEKDIVRYERKNMYCPSASFHNQDLASLHWVYYNDEKHQFWAEHYQLPDLKHICDSPLGFNDERAEENNFEVVGNGYDNPELLEVSAK